MFLLFWIMMIGWLLEISIDWLIVDCHLELLYKKMIILMKKKRIFLLNKNKICHVQK